MRMFKNKDCGLYLGNIAEQLLSKVFKGVKIMPHGNPGYDFICAAGYKIDVKSACRSYHKRESYADNWIFSIEKNEIADYFFCLAFDNRASLTPEHVWLLPKNVVNHLVCASISETTLDRWGNMSSRSIKS